MKKNETAEPYVLGLDLGAASVGWALVRLDTTGQPTSVVRLGVRAFEAGVEGDIEQGKDSSRAAVRRQKRLLRRGFWRRARRVGQLFRLLQSHGLLPPGECKTPQERHELLLKLDAEIRVRHLTRGDRVAFHLMPYRLRAWALGRALEPFELGRAIYHLAQRRGFKSNRKDARADPAKEDQDNKWKKKDAESPDAALAPDKEPSLHDVKKQIATLAGELQRTGLTLGAYFNTLDPEQARIRQRFTSRKMYEDEFDAIWRAQAAHRPDMLTESLKKNIYQAIFFQRPLKSAAHLIGHCELDEKHRRRAAIALPIAQRFRTLQKVNDLEVYEPNGDVRKLTSDERSRLLAELSKYRSRTFDQVRTFFKWKKPKTRKDEKTGVTSLTQAGHTFNLESGGEKKLPGDSTSSELAKVFGERWAGFPPAERERIVLDILSFQNPDALKKHGEVKLGLAPEGAEALAEVALEDGRSAHCRPVLEKLIAGMEDGTPYAQARRELYPERFEAKPALDRLPPALDVPALKDFKNPAVLRAITELRKVVNAIVARYGKPAAICIELARDLKSPRPARERMAKDNRENQRIREDAAAELLRETGITNPRNDDIEKVRLAKECNWECPYTGKGISWESLFGENPQFDVEHILPRKYLDNSFANKTLCDADFNRNHKKDRLPTECFDPNSQEWHEVIERVSRFHSPVRGAKLKRFQMTAEDIEDDFVTRQLNDTRMATSKGQGYLGLLYGGVDDATGKKRVYGVSGLTALLRAQWDLNSILPKMPDAPKLADSGRAPLNVKSRVDHRHHAIDALVVAMTSPAIVGELSAAAGQAGQRFLRSFQIALPWAGFWQEAFDAASRIVVSHRPDRRVAGPLHAETIYSKPLPAGPGEKAHRVRRPVEKLKPADFAPVPLGEPITLGVADRAVRDAIRGKWEELCVKAGTELPPEKAFKSPDDFPFLITGDKRRIPIGKARVIVNDNPKAVGKGYRQRFVDSGKDTLHHTCIVAERHRDNEKWNDYPVTRLDMHSMLASRKPNEKRGRNDYACPCPRPCQGIKNAGKRVMWLCKGDMIEMDVDGVDSSKGRSLYAVKGVSSGDIKVRLHQDARLDKDVSRAGDRNRFRITSADSFRKRRARKVTISPIGEVSGNEPSAGLG